MGERDREEGVGYPTVLGEVKFFIEKPMFCGVKRTWKKLYIILFCRLFLFIRVIICGRRNGVSISAMRCSLTISYILKSAEKVRKVKRSFPFRGAMQVTTANHPADSAAICTH